MAGWSSYRRWQHSEAMRRSAEGARCPTCGRKSAVVIRFDGERHTAECRWVALGKCSGVRSDG